MRACCRRDGVIAQHDIAKLIAAHDRLVGSQLEELLAVGVGDLESRHDKDLRAARAAGQHSARGPRNAHGRPPFDHFPIR